MIDPSRGIKGFFPKGVAYWALDGTPAGLVDQYGNGSNAATAGVSSKPSIIHNGGSSGYAFDNDVTKIITLPYNILMNSPQVTVISWAIPSYATGLTEILLCKFRNTTTGNAYRLAFLPPNNVTFQTTNLDGAVNVLNSATAINGRGKTNNKPTCFIGTLDVNLKLTLYINGDVVAEAQSLAGYIKTNNDAAIGRLLGSTQPFNGIIGESAILSYAITSQQAADYYKYATETPVKYWFFGDSLNLIAQRVNESAGIVDSGLRGIPQPKMNVPRRVFTR